MKRIIKTEESAKNERTYRGGLFYVWFEGPGDEPVTMFKDQYDLVVFEDELLQRGISSADIENHKDLVSAWRADEAASDAAGIDI